MANICLYKIKVRGLKDSCYKLIDMMPLYSSEKEILSEEGIDNDFTLIFTGDCKWSVDSYTKKHKNIKPFTLDEIEKIKDGDYWDYPLSEKALVLGCEIWCNSKDIDSSSMSVYQHYNVIGKELKDDCPKELHIKQGRDYDTWHKISESPVSKGNGKTARVKFSDGHSYEYSVNNLDVEIGSIVMVEGSMNGVFGQVVSVNEDVFTDGFKNIVEIINLKGTLLDGNIPEDIWNSFSKEDKNKFFDKYKIEKTRTKKKFLSIMNGLWIEFNAKFKTDIEEFKDSII